MKTLKKIQELYGNITTTKKLKISLKTLEELTPKTFPFKSSNSFAEDLVKTIAETEFVCLYRMYKNLERRDFK